MKKTQIKPRDINGKKIKENNLTDLQALVLDEINKIDLAQIKKFGGHYFIWSCIPQSNKAFVNQHMKDKNAWFALVGNLNQLINKMFKGKIELILRKK